MSWFTSAWHAVTHPSELIGDGEHLLSDGEHWVGQVADQGAHLVGRGLTDIGLGQVGNWVDGLGDDAASALDPELQLGQTDDPTQLIHGDPAAIRKAAGTLHEFSGAFGQTATGLDGIDTSHWSGSAAEAFRAKYAPEPGKWRDASTASGAAGGALESYAGTVQWAQDQAREAISVYAEGQKATTAAMTSYNDQVDAYDAAARQYDAHLSAGQNPGPRPAEPAAFSDPGAALRERAQQILAAARAERDRAGSAAASAVTKATALAPASPGLWSQVTDTVTDGVQFTNLAGASLDSGVLTGVADIGKLVRDVNPADPWNMAHPAEYLAGLSGIGAGIVHDAVHPQDLAGQLLGSGWGSDPFQAAGKLVPQVALALATDGGGTAADAAGDAATGAAADAGRSLSDALADPGTASRPTDAMVQAGDPVDVATGDVILTQADVALAAALPLVLRRTHRSGYRAGRWFGRSWASTLDQRLEVGERGVFFADDDGAVLCYPRPGADPEPVLPVAGARWPLARDAHGYTVTDPQAGVTLRFEPRSGFYLSAEGNGELPLVSVADRAGHQVRFEYGPDGAPRNVAVDGGSQVKVTVSGGRVVGLAMAGSGQEGGDAPLVRFGYDASGNLAEVVNSSGAPLRLSYDEAGRLTGWQDRNGWAYQYHYDEQGRCVRGDGPEGTLSDSFSYDPGAVTTHTDATGAVTVYQITEGSQIAAVTDPLGGITRCEYDANGRLLARTDPLGRQTRWSYDQAGNLTALIRPDGSQATVTYDQMNLPVRVTDAGRATWRQDYDDTGNLIRVTAPDGTVTAYSWDGRGNLAAVTDPLGSVTRVECDAAGLLATVTGPDGGLIRLDRDEFGRVTMVTGPDGSVTRMAWTPEGHLAARMYPDAGVERFAYDGEGNLVAQISPAGAITRFGYTCFDELAAQTGPDGTRAEFIYDKALRLTSVTVSASPARASGAAMTWRYEHDAAGNLTAQTDVNGAATRYCYDAAGQLTRQVNAAGQQLCFSYDALGNVTERIADGTVTTFGYDPSGRLERAASPDALVEFRRDPAGRVVAETCNGAVLTSEYNAAGQRTRRVTPAGARSKWSYDASGRPGTLTAANQQVRFGYDQAGRETLRRLPGGLRLSQEWNAAGLLAAQVLTTRGAPGPGTRGDRVLQRRGYSYLADGTVRGVDDLLAGPRRLTLDRAGRVTGVQGVDWGERYAYDAAGNVTAASWPAPPGPAADWLGRWAQGARSYSGTLITRAGSVRYQHDAAGRITLRQRIRDSRKPDTWRYEWDGEDRLTAVTTPDGTIWRYRYDPLGRRIAKERLNTSSEVAEQVRFTWDGPLLAEQAATGEVLTWDYHPDTLAPLTQVERWRRAPQARVDRRFYAIVTDLIGTPSELTAADGQLAGYQQHTLWGATVWHPGGNSTPLRFPGQYADDETGLHYNNHRYYDPATGRYLSPDPLGLAGDANPHAYVTNPTVLVDPLGLMACGTKIDPPAQIKQMTGPVYAWAPKGATSDEIAQVKAYVDGSNRALKDGYLSPDGRVSTRGALRQAASRDAARVRAAARRAGDTSYEGMHVGHVPDTTWTGKPQGYEYMPLTPRVNQSLGYWTQAYPQGYVPTKFVYVTYANRYRYLYGRLFGTG